MMFAVKCLSLLATPFLLTCVLVSPFLTTKAALYTVKMMNMDNRCPQPGPRICSKTCV